uniref:ATP synthase subunit b, chloroplastic n=1 Tax=Rhexinema sarcinoideum TaxID=43261 RepID=A0A1B2RYJ3_9CHLO|nr:CF0 subunit I of ATP synthase [Rhexinema sarcinoideum]
MNFITIGFLFSGHGFGLNTNILETNVINLAVVIAVVISFVGDAVRELLKNRKEIILNNLREADNRALMAQENLNQAKEQFAAAQKKAAEIREQGLVAAEQEKNLCLKQAEENAAQLKQVQENTIRFQQQKAIQQISQQIVSLAFQQVRQKIKSGSSALFFHPKVNNLKIELLKRSLVASSK